jgi:chromosome partitioning protein
MIRENVALAEAPARQSDIFSYAPKSAGALDYLNLAKEIITRIEGKDFPQEVAAAVEKEA